MHVNTIISEPSIKIIKRNVNIAIMPLSIVGPTIPPGAEGGERWGFDQTSDQIPHHLGRLGSQIPS